MQVSSIWEVLQHTPISFQVFFICASLESRRELDAYKHVIEYVLIAKSDKFSSYSPETDLNNP